MAEKKKKGLTFNLDDPQQATVCLFLDKIRRGETAFLTALAYKYLSDNLGDLSDISALSKKDAWNLAKFAQYSFLSPNTEKRKPAAINTSDDNAILLTAIINALTNSSTKMQGNEVPLSFQGLSKTNSTPNAVLESATSKEPLLDLLRAEPKKPVLNVNELESLIEEDKEEDAYENAVMDTSINESLLNALNGFDIDLL